MRKYLVLLLACVLFFSCRPQRKCAAYNSTMIESHYTDLK